MLFPVGVEPGETGVENQKNFIENIIRGKRYDDMRGRIQVFRPLFF